MSESGILKPGEIIKVVVELSEVKNLLKSVYGLDHFTLTEMNGYDDKNYKVSVDCPDNSERTEYTLKIMNSLDSKNSGLVEAQNNIMFLLSSKGVVCPKPIKNNRDEYFFLHSFLNGHYVVRLLSYVPGSILFKEKPTPQFYYQLGLLVAQIDITLKDFYHEALYKRKNIWMMNYIPELHQYLFAVEDDHRRNTLKQIIVDFEERVLSRNDLEKGPIHGDINEQNILTKVVDNELVISGILDFGDISYTNYLFELAITVAYMMIMENSLEASGYVIAGYSKIRSIPDKELSLLKISAMARICQSYILGTYTSLLQPDNLYVLVVVEKGWDLLQKMLNETEEETLSKWTSIANNYS